jgi:hypothetical protein
MTIGSSPNDPLYSKQWALSSNQTPGTTTAGIRAEGAWDIATGAGIVIGVVDSGITSRSDLNPKVLPGYEFVFTSSTNPVVNYDFPGTYQIILTTTDANGAISTTSLPVDVAALSITDITDHDYGVRFQLVKGDMLYFSVTIPRSPVKSLRIALPGSTTTSTLGSGSSKDVVTLETRGDTASMVSPDCSSTLSDGVAATCSGRSTSHGRTFYARVTARTAVDDAKIDRFFVSEINPSCRLISLDATFTCLGDVCSCPQ